VPDRKWLAAYLLIAAVALGRVAATYRVFSAVVDEPVHIAAGYQWWHGEPAWDALHPPLAKLLFAIPFRADQPPATRDRGAYAFELLYAHPDDVRALAHARLPNLLFLLIALVAVIAWARRFGEGIGVVAAAMLAAMPPILGHAGLATTDMAVAAMLPVALLALERWIRLQTWRAALLLGLAMGLGALTKYSFLLFFPVCAVVMIAAVAGCGLPVAGCRLPADSAGNWQLSTGNHSRRLVAGATLALVAALVVIWAGYRLQFAPLATFRSVTMPPPDTLSKPVAWLYTRVPIPAPSFFGGLVILKWYNLAGRPAFLLGQVSTTGWWYYFPVVFFFKTPLPFLLLSLAGIAALIRRRTPDAVALALMPVALMLSVLDSRINIGVRHILPIYPLLCVAAAAGAAALRRPVAAVALAWLFIGTAVGHPDYLAWFNEAAGPHPERIAVDSNLDWGQDMLRLARLTRQSRIDTIALFCVRAMPFDRHGARAAPLPPITPTPGWIAASETMLAISDEARAGGYAWLGAYPYERVGRSIRLYRVPRRPATPRE
jgi:hypothetical protein